MRKVASAALALFLGFAFAPAKAAEGIEVPAQDWSFSGIFGTFERDSLQRGFQVYREVCSGCHALKYIAFRNLVALGYNEEEIKALAAQFQVTDGPNDEGEMFERDGAPSDPIPAPFPNEKAARAANGGAYPPDLSLMAKARAGGPDYLYALLIGYEEPPADVEVMEGMYYNAYFPGHQIAMPSPLSEGLVDYADGTEATAEQMAHDVSHFLMWTAEPKLEVRKQTGVKVILFLLVFTGLMYAVKRRIWADLH